MIHRIPFDDNVVCIDSNTDDVVVANAVAADIWCWSREGADRAVIAKRLVKSYDVSLDRAQDDVDALLAALGRQVFDIRANFVRELDLPESLPGREFIPVEQFSCFVPGYRIQIRSEMPGLEVAFREILPLSRSRARLDGNGNRTITLDILNHGMVDGQLPRWLVIQAGRTVAAGHNAREVAFLAAQSLIGIVGETLGGDAVLMHAAAVADGNGEVVVMPAVGGRGKTTLAATLVARGWRLVNDDVLILRAASQGVQPLTLPMSIKEGSWGVLAPSYPMLGDTVAHGVVGRRVKLLPVPGEQQFTETGTISTFCIPQYRADAAGVQVVEMSRKDMLCGILQSGCYFTRPIDVQVLEHLCALIEGANALSLTYDDVCAAAKVLAGNSR